MILKMMICILLFLRNLGKEFLLNSFMQMKSQFMLWSQVDFKCFEILSSHKVHTTTQQNRRKKTKRGRKKEQVLLHTMLLIIIIIIEPANVDDFYEGACTHIINAFSCSLLFMLKILCYRLDVVCFVLAFERYAHSTDISLFVCVSAVCAVILYICVFSKYHIISLCPFIAILKQFYTWGFNYFSVC